MALIMGSIQLGLIYALLALGVYVTFRVLNLPDLTVEGSFTFGLAVSAALTVAGHPYLAILAAVLAGGLAGVVTGLLQTKAGIPSILAGILTMSGLYSINLFVMGSRSNLSLIGADGLFELGAALLPGWDKEAVKTLIPALFCVASLGALTWFFHTHLGLCIRATGNNEDMVRASSINVDMVKVIALAVANGCVGLSGAVLAQYQRYADIGSGVGMVVVGLASVIIGEAVIGRRSVTLGFVSALTGSIAYRFIIALALRTDFFPAYALKLVSAVIVAVALAIPTVKRKLELSKIRREAVRKC